MEMSRLKQVKTEHNILIYTLWCNQATSLMQPVGLVLLLRYRQLSLCYQATSLMQPVGLVLLLRYRQLSLCYQTTSLMQSVGLAPSGGIDTGPSLHRGPSFITPVSPVKWLCISVHTVVQ